MQAAGVEVDQIGAIKVDFSFFASCLFSSYGIFLHLEFTSHISFTHKPILYQANEFATRASFGLCILSNLMWLFLIFSLFRLTNILAHLLPVYGLWVMLQTGSI